MASPAVLRRRLSSRIAFVRTGLRRETWAMQQMQRCVSALAQERYGTHIRTDDATVDEVVETIALDAGLTLTSPRLTPVRHRIRRLSVGIRHIR